MKRYGQSLFVVAAITALYAGLRLFGITNLVTTDEPFWLGRSANFFRALVDGDLAHTYQMAHPGVMTMWAGAAAYLIRFPEYADLAAGNLNNVYSIESVLREMGRDPLEMMIAARISKIILQTIFFAICLIYLRKLAGNHVTVVTGLLIAFAPFMSGFDSALHVDGLFVIICFAAILAVCWAAFERKGSPYWPWAVAGLLSAMAWLTRSTGVALIGVVGLALILQLYIHASQQNGLRSGLLKAIKQGVVWLTAATITTYALLPALWVAPGSTLEKLWSWSSNAATEGHENPTFFMGIHHGNPGYSVYPIVSAWRTSPVEWLGVLLLIAFGWWGWKHHPSLSPTLAKTLLVCVVFSFVYLAAMSIGAKKFDRYILPIFPVIALLAGTGIVLAMDWIRQQKWPRTSLISSSLAGLLILGQAVAWSSSLPYRLDYYNPILGGAERAQHILQMGWGQGGDQVVEFLNDQIGEQPVVVQTSAVPSAFTYFLANDSPILFRSFGLDTPAGWYETDYYVAGIQQTQRDLAPAYRVLRAYEPTHSVNVGGVPYFQIFNVNNLPLPEHLTAITACNFSFGEEITLMQIIERDQTVDLYFLSTETVSGEHVMLSIMITAPDGSNTVQQATLTPSAQRLMSRGTIQNPSNNGQLADYQITLSATIADKPLDVTAPWQPEPSRSATTQSECYYTDPPEGLSE